MRAISSSSVDTMISSKHPADLVSHETAALEREKGGDVPCLDQRVDAADVQCLHGGVHRDLKRGSPDAAAAMPRRHGDMHFSRVVRAALETDVTNRAGIRVF